MSHILIAYEHLRTTNSSKYPPLHLCPYHSRPNVYSRLKAALHNCIMYYIPYSRIQQLKLQQQQQPLQQPLQQLKLQQRQQQRQQKQQQELNRVSPTNFGRIL